MEISLQSHIGKPRILTASTVHRNNADVNMYSNPESFKECPSLSSEGTFGCHRKEKEGLALPELKDLFMILFASILLPAVSECCQQV